MTDDEEQIEFFDGDVIRGVHGSVRTRHGGKWWGPFEAFSDETARWLLAQKSTVRTEYAPEKISKSNEKVEYFDTIGWRLERGSNK